MQNARLIINNRHQVEEDKVPDDYIDAGGYYYGQGARQAKYSHLKQLVLDSGVDSSYND